MRFTTVRRSPATFQYRNIISNVRVYFKKYLEIIFSLKNCANLSIVCALVQRCGRARDNCETDDFIVSLNSRQLEARKQLRLHNLLVLSVHNKDIFNAASSLAQ